MTSRLYRTTRPLAAQVALMLGCLGIRGVASPTTAALIALYVSLILLDGRQTQTRVALFLPAGVSAPAWPGGSWLSAAGSGVWVPGRFAGVWASALRWSSQ